MRFSIMCCPKCGGVLFIESDMYGEYISCLMCGYSSDTQKQQEGKTMTIADVESSRNGTVECPYCNYTDDKKMVEIHKVQAHPPRRPPLGKLTEPERAELSKNGVAAFAERHGYTKENRNILWQAYYKHNGKHNGSNSAEHIKQKKGNHRKVQPTVEAAKPIKYLKAVIEVYENIPLILSYINSITEKVNSGKVEISMSYVGDKNIQLPLQTD